VTRLVISSGAPEHAAANLSERELAVLTLPLTGLHNQEIAEQLTSPSAVPNAYREQPDDLSSSRARDALVTDPMTYHPGKPGCSGAPTIERD